MGPRLEAERYCHAWVRGPQLPESGDEVPGGRVPDTYGLIKPYSWRWWLAVLFNGGPPRGDGRTYLRNPKARAALEELRRGLEEAEWRERGDASEQARVRNDLAAAPVRGPRHGRPSGRTEDDMELHEI